MRLSGMYVSFLLIALPLPAELTSVITGDYMEDRSNRVYGCYCEWSSEREVGGKEAILAWSIKSGDFRGTSLAGVKMAAVILGEHSLSIGSAPRKSILFVDSEASSEQRRAAESLLRESYGHLLGKVLSVHYMPIDFQKQVGKATVRVGDLVDLKMREARPKEDAMQGAILWFDPFVPLTESTLGTTVNSKYTGDDFDLRWNWSDPGITGYYGSFSLSAGR